MAIQSQFILIFLLLEVCLRHTFTLGTWCSVGWPVVEFFIQLQSEILRFCPWNYLHFSKYSLYSFSKLQFLLWTIIPTVVCLLHPYSPCISTFQSSDIPVLCLHSTFLMRSSDWANWFCILCPVRLHQLLSEILSDSWQSPCIDSRKRLHLC